MGNGPTKERRIEAAMALAGLDFDTLAERIATKNYGSRTLRRLANPKDTARPPRGPDLAVIAKACGVSEAFWTVDFSTLEEPDLRDQVSVLEQQVADLQDASQQALQAIEELQRRDRPEERPEDG